MRASRERVTGLPRPPSSDRGNYKYKGLLHLPRRLQHKEVLLLLTLVITFLCLFLINSLRAQTSRALKDAFWDPPNYYKWYEREKALPQNDPSLPPPQGRRGRYIRFKNHMTRERGCSMDSKRRAQGGYLDVGWGNVMQDMVVNHHLAYRTNRIFVMYNYTWGLYPNSDYSRFDGQRIPSRIPISALISGPMAGGSYPVNDYHPPAVTAELFEEVCPHPTLLSINAIRAEYSIDSDSAATMLDKYTAALNAVEDNCIEMQEGTGHIFDFGIFGSGSRMADAWPQFLASPILTEWAWSPLVKSIVTQNSALIHPDIGLLDMRQRVDLKGLLAVHLRRGDFKGHCQNLANKRSGYHAFNVRPDFADQFDIPPGDDEGGHSDETLAWYMDHCFPDISRIVRRVVEFRADAAKQGRTLDRMYIATNGRRGWINALTDALNEAATWKSINTSQDLLLDWEQEFVKHAADMLIATRAEVFVGNAWSSLSSNVNLLRMAQKQNPQTSRFW